MHYFFRYLYNLIFYCIFPCLFARLYWRARHISAYKQRLVEFKGIYSINFSRCLWVHAVSVGEIIAATPLIKALQSRYPTLTLLITTTTATGAEQVRQTFGHRVQHVYLPFDLPHMMARFFNTMNPRLAILMETELWPNLLRACYQRNIPVCVLNARLSARSAKRYQYIRPFMRTLLQPLQWIAAQSETDAQRFLALGALKTTVTVCGNLKFDLEISPKTIERGIHLRQTLGGEKRFIWIAASTHLGEDEIILNAHRLLRTHHRDALLILVPRHPARFQSVATLCQKEPALMTIRRSENTAFIAKDMAVYLGDTMGELLMLYSAADVAFIGGSLVPHGGHNMIEAAALGKALLSGPFVFNFASTSLAFDAACALLTVHDAKSLGNTLVHLAQHPSERLQRGARAQQVVAKHRGSLEKQFNAINALLRKVQLA